MEPLLTIGALQLTPYGLLIFAGALCGTLLAARKKAARPALPWVVLLAVVCAHLVWCWMSDTYMETYGLSLLYQFWRGGYTLYGAVLGGALGALIGARLTREAWLDITDALAPGAAALLFFARMGEYFSGQGMGDTLRNGELAFFPLAYVPWGEEAEAGAWLYPVWFWEAAAALILLAVLLARRNPRRGDLTFLFLTVLGTTQIFFEQLRYDEIVYLTGFVRFSQIAAIASLLVVMGTLVYLRRPPLATTLLSFAVLVCAALTVVFVEFILDNKTRYLPFLYGATAATAIVSAAALLVIRGPRGRMSAGLSALTGCILLFSYVLEDPEAGVFVVLYGFMAWAVAVMGVAVSLVFEDKQEVVSQ